MMNCSEGWGVSDLAAGPGFGAPAFHRGSGAGLGFGGAWVCVHWRETNECRSAYDDVCRLMHLFLQGVNFLDAESEDVSY